MARRLSITPRFEWAVIVLVGVAIGLAFVIADAQSERLAMTLAIRNMRSGLQWAIAEKLMRGEDNRLAELKTANPLEFIGASESPQSAGNWRFDARRDELVYLPRIKAAFDGREELRWRIEGVPGAAGRISGLRLVEVAPAPARH